MANAVTAPAATNTETWLAFWEQRPLPLLQSTKTALEQFSGRAETARTDEIVALILRDPLLTTTALRLVNQRPRTGLISDVVAIENVVLLMGVNALLDKFSKLPTVESILLPKLPAAYVALLREISTARLAARLAREFANLRYDARLEEIYVTALLAGLPKMLRIVESGLAQQPPKVDLGVAALPLFARWRLPEVFTTLLDDSGSATQRSMMQQAVLRLADRLQLGWWQGGISDDIHLVASTAGIDDGACWEVICKALLHFARKDWPYPQIFPPARWLVMQAGEWPRPPAKAEAKAPEPAKPTFEDFLRELQRTGHTPASFNQVMALAIRALSEGIGVQRIVFALLLAGQNALKARYVVGASGDDPLRGFHIDLGAPHIVTRLMLKPQSIWLNRGNQAQYEALLPKSLRQSVGEGEFFAMSLFVEDKAVGLFYVDNRNAAGLTEAQYNAFKQVCMVTGQSLTRQAQRLDLGGPAR